MRAIPVLFLFVIGTFFILARGFLARFFMSYAHQVPGMKERERDLLYWIGLVSVVFGAGFIVLGLLMALNIVFVW